MVPIHVDDQIRGSYQEFLPDAQQTAVADGPAQHPAEDITPSLIGRQDPVPNHEGDGTGMVGNDLQGNIILGIRIVSLARNLAGIFDDGEDQVRLEVAGFVLEHRSHPFQS